MEFVKGNWYKGADDDKYIKFSHLVPRGSYNELHHTEEIYNKIHSYTIDYWANTNLEEFALNNPVDLWEIQQYLPEDHPDLITTYVDKKEDLSYLESVFKKLNII
jgi:hypothetical protein